jgi:DNA-binding transcriptional ArsR family regulator
MARITSTGDPRYVKAMSHPVRARAMAMLRERQASPAELSNWLGTTLGATAYHVRTLHRLGLIELVAEGRVRGAVEHFYRAVQLPDHQAGDNPVLDQAHADAVLTMLEARLRPVTAAGGLDHAHATLSQRELPVDEQGMTALATECRKLLERATRISEQSVKRLAKANGDGSPTNALVGVFAIPIVALADQIAPRTTSSRAASRRTARPVAKRRETTSDLVLEQLARGPRTVAELASAVGRSVAGVRIVVSDLQRSHTISEHSRARAAGVHRGPHSKVYALSD